MSSLCSYLDSVDIPKRACPQGVPFLGSKTYLAEPLMTYRGQTVVSVTKVTSQTIFFLRIDQGYFSELTSCTVYKHQSRVAFLCLIFMIKSFAVWPSQDTYVLTKLHNIKVTFEERKWTNRITRICLIVYPTGRPLIMMFILINKVLWQ